MILAHGGSLCGADLALLATAIGVAYRLAPLLWAMLNPFADKE